jgi:hypothetical protein
MGPLRVTLYARLDGIDRKKRNSPRRRPRYKNIRNATYLRQRVAASRKHQKATLSRITSISDNEYYVNFYQNPTLAPVPLAFGAVSVTFSDSLSPNKKTARPPLKGVGPMGRN